MATSRVITYGELQRLLLALGFSEELVESSHRAFRHAATGTLIVLAYYYDIESPLRIEDVVSVRRHLTEKGLADARILASLAAPVGQDTAR